MDNNYKVLGVCGGNGVLLYPFKDNLIGNIEPRSIFKTPDYIQWKLNFPNIDFAWKLSQFSELYKKPDIIIGAPDCGHSSILAYSRAKKMSNPKKNESLNIFFESIKKYKPKIWLMENLPPLLDTITEEDFKTNFPDYKFIFMICPVSEFGNSQIHRKRLLVIGIKKDSGIPKKYFQFPFKIHELKTCGELLKGLHYHEDEGICHVRENLSDIITLYAGFKINLSDCREEWLRRGTKRWKVEGRNFENAPGVYLNPKDDFPATARKQNRQFNHKGYMMSPRELGRIQGVPDEFKLWYDGNKKRYCINKARVSVTKCPPFEIGTWFRKCISNCINGT
jgi:site-specific DNA-cytosine methylase